MYNLKSSLERWLKKEGVTDTEAECVLSNSNMIQKLILDSVFSAGGPSLATKSCTDYTE